MRKGRQSPLRGVRSPFGLRPGAGGGGGITQPSYGFLSSYDLGTTGDYFVDQVNGSDANPGTSMGAAKATPEAAMALATAGKTVRVAGDGVSYRRLLTMKAGVKVLAYGTHKPVWSAAEVLTGWVQCTGADAAVLGSVTPANIWKRTGLAKSGIASGSGFGLNMIEAGVKMPIARTFGAVSNNPIFGDTTNDWISVTTNLSTIYVASWVLPASLAALTSAQVMQGMIRFVSEPNSNRTDLPASYTQGTRTLVPTGTTWEYENNANKDKLTIINILPLIQQGQYAFIDNGSTVDVYVWPTNTANLTAGMEYAARDKCVDLGTAGDIELAGFVLANAASASTNPADGGHAISGNSTTARSNVNLHHLKIQNTERVRDGYGVFDIRSTANLSITDCEVVDAVGQFGMFLRGTTGSTTPGTIGLGWTPMTGLYVARNFIRRTESGPMRIYSNRDGAIVRNVMEYNGIGPHSNKISLYEQCHNVLLLFNRFRGANGYVTWQEASDICLIANDMTVSYNADDSGNIGRGVEDQNTSTASKPPPSRFDPAYKPTVNGSYAFNNRVLPYDLFGASEDRSFNLGSSDTTVFFSAWNNIINGSANTVPAQITAFDRNFYTNGSGVAGFDANSQFSTGAATYVDAAVGNFAFAPGSAVRSMTAQNLSAVVTALQARFPQVTDWTTDQTGRPMNWAAPKIGPFADYDNQGTFAVSRIRWPAISGATSVGQVLTADTGWVEVDPWPGQITQWQRSLDQVTWADISGATSPTYTIVTGDATYYPRIKVTTGGDVAYSPAGTIIASSYPIGTPTVLATYGDSTTGTQYETGSFATTNKPLLVLVFQNVVTTADTAQTVTIGTAGRTVGTGTNIPQGTLGRRTNSQMTAHYIAASGTATQTIQVTSAASSNGIRVVVLEIQGAASLGATAHIGATTTTRTPSVLTTAINGIVIYAGYKSNSTGETLSVADATVLDVGNTGAASSTDTACLVAWELAPAIATYDATITALASGAFGASALELKS